MKNTKIGDIFCVTLNQTEKQYFQYVANDLNQLNSDVIRVFKRRYPIEQKFIISEILNDEILFSAHCATIVGIKLGFWEKAGNSDNVGKPDTLFFRDTDDYGTGIKKSLNWHVWKVSDSGFTKVGKLEGKNEKAEIGVVIPPDSIVHCMQTGHFDFTYPEW